MEKLPIEILEKVLIQVPKTTRVELVNKKMRSVCININHKRDICKCALSIIDCIECSSSRHICVCDSYQTVFPICKNCLI